MPNRNHYTLILWGKRFEEMPAITFVTALRQAGLPVKLVGLDGRCAPGVYGVTLLADLTLDQALQMAHQAVCLIAPCASTLANRLMCDPRLGKLVQQAQYNQAICLIGRDATSGLLLPDPGPPSADPLLLVADFKLYPEGDDLVAFARELALTLAHWGD